MADFVVTSGGVSVGVYDLVKEVLGEIGTIDFWQVAMQPGRPLAFGRIGQTHVLRPARQPGRLAPGLHALRPPRPLQAGRAARRPIPRRGTRARRSRCARRPGRREFKRGVLTYRDGALGGAHRPGPQGSGILSSMVAGNCLIVLEEERGDVAPGETASWSSRSRSPVSR